MRLYFLCFVASLQVAHSAHIAGGGGTRSARNACMYANSCHLQRNASYYFLQGKKAILKLHVFGFCYFLSFAKFIELRHHVIAFLPGTDVIPSFTAHFLFSV